MLENSLAALEKKRKESWQNNPRSLSPPPSLPLTLTPFHPYTDLHRPFINKAEFKQLSEELKSNIERIGLMTKPAHITAKVPTVKEQKGKKKSKLKVADEDDDSDFMPEPWDESLPRDRGLSYFHDSSLSPSRTP